MLRWIGVWTSCLSVISKVGAANGTDDLGSPEHRGYQTARFLRHIGKYLLQCSMLSINEGPYFYPAVLLRGIALPFFICRQSVLLAYFRPLGNQTGS
jgi:hypothetical protein